MSIAAQRWWRCTPEGMLLSLYMETRWETPVLTTKYPVVEVYHVRVTGLVSDTIIVEGEVLEKPNVWNAPVLIARQGNMKVGQIVEHERGWRAEKALVSGPLTLYKQDKELAKKIADRYDCDVTCTKESPYGLGKDDSGI